MASRHQQFRFLVIGAGSIGRRHIRNLLALEAGEVFAFDVREDRRSEVGSEFGISVLDRLEDAWPWDPDVVLITTPTSLHLPLALQAAQRGCHLFIEKPLADKLGAVDELLQVVRQKNLVTLVGCNMRFHPGLQRVKELLDEGAIGRVVAARVEVGQYLPDWHPWEDYRHTYSARKDLGGGIILDAIHEIDYIRWFLGDVETVACFAGHISNLDIETEDTAAILLRFRNGAIGEVHMDYVQRAYSRTCHIIGDGGTIHWDYVEGAVRLYTAASGAWSVWDNPAGWEPNQMYVDELTHFVRCLSGEEEPVQDVFEAARVLEVAEAAKISAERHEVVCIQPTLVDHGAWDDG